MVASKSPVKRILAALSAFDVADRPMSRLDAARRLREAAEELEAAQVEAARNQAKPDTGASGSSKAEPAA